nr:hypothetical protein [Mycolicibacterium peregrinum]
MPDKLAAAELYDDPPGLTALPEEAELVARAVAKRRNEFTTVRYCARQALGELGVGPVPILKGDKGEPCWPDGIVGSARWPSGPPSAPRCATAPARRWASWAWAPSRS